MFKIYLRDNNKKDSALFYLIPTIHCRIYNAVDEYGPDYADLNIFTIGISFLNYSAIILVQYRSDL